MGIAPRLQRGGDGTDGLVGLVRLTRLGGVDLLGGRQPVGERRRHERDATCAIPREG
jgi:hypothetical protein